MLRKVFYAIKQHGNVKYGFNKSFVFSQKEKQNIFA